MIKWWTPSLQGGLVSEPIYQKKLFLNPIPNPPWTILSKSMNDKISLGYCRSQKSAAKLEKNSENPTCLSSILRRKETIAVVPSDFWLCLI